MTKVAVILSGCGVYDGAEINEAVLTLLALEQQGATYQCFAPDVEQMHVINHLTGEPVEGESRNVLVEAARIARGDVLPSDQIGLELVTVLRRRKRGQRTQGGNEGKEDAFHGSRGLSPRKCPSNPLSANFATDSSLKRPGKGSKQAV